MRAFGYRTTGDAGVEEFLDLPVPEPLGGELRIEVVAAGVNPADYKRRSGAYGEPDLPAVLGREASGVVRAVGPDVEGFAVGDEVFGGIAAGSGGFAEYAILTAAFTAHKPPHLSFTDAATLPVAAATAYDALRQLGLTAGQTLLLNGASGGVGVAAAQLARDLGLAVVGTGRPANQGLIESFDAIFVAYGDGVADRVREILPDGVDGILDLAGGDSLRAVAELLKDRDKLVSAGDRTVGDLGGHLVERDRSRGPLDALAALVADRKLDPKVEDIRPLDEAHAAVAAVETGHAKGKVVIQVR